MKPSYGTNKKLGPRVGSVSRPVGPTCPDSCPFASWNEDSSIPRKLRCYAEKIEKRWTSVSKSWREGLHATADDVYRVFAEAPAKIRAIRIHVGGDWLREGGKLDKRYIRAWLTGLARARAAGFGQPAWFYTHVWRELAKYAPPERWLALGVQPFASVHNLADACQASYLGYRLAWDQGEAPGALSDLPVKDAIHNALNCPEQRKGADRVDCGKCTYCFQPGQGHVGFWRHV